MEEQQKASALEDAIFGYKSDFKRYKEKTKEGWNVMMFNASLKALVSIRIELLVFINRLGDSGKVKKHAKKLARFFKRLNDIENIDLNSSTYIKHVLVPAKQLRKEFEVWKTQSVTNIIDGKEIADLENEAEQKTEEVLAELPKAA